MLLKDKILELTEKYVPYMIQTRRYLHQHPEVSFKEFETTKFIKKELTAIGIPYESPLETGCIGIIEGGISSNRVIALRADIDALPIQEDGQAKVDFMSQNPGVAHCCGHDAHTSNLLGAAKILYEMKDNIEGKVLFVFQPGEEKLPGGGKLLCDTEFLQRQNVEAIYGLHTDPLLTPGTIATKSGPLMGAPDEFMIEIFGKGGHAARPHEAIDPIVIASQFITTVQTIVSRNIDPTDAAVVTIGKIEGGTAHNIIPESVRMLGTVRTLSKKDADLIEERLESILKGVVMAAGGSYTFSFNRGYPVVMNTKPEAERVLANMRELFGDESAIELEKPIMAGEDFAFYQEHFPGAFFFAGSGSPESDSQYVWHHPNYNVDERFFNYAAPLMATIVLNGQ